MSVLCSQLPPNGQNTALKHDFLDNLDLDLEGVFWW